MTRITLYRLTLLLAMPMVLHAQDVGSRGEAPSRSDNSSKMGQVMRQMPIIQPEMYALDVRLLQQKTGLSANDLLQMYLTSGVRSFEEFAVAIVVTKNLGLDIQKVLSSIKGRSLVQALQDTGLSKDAAEAAIGSAQREIEADEDADRAHTTC